MKSNASRNIILITINTVMLFVAIALIVFGVLFLTSVLGDFDLVPGLPVLFGGVLLFMFSVVFFISIKSTIRRTKENPNKTYFGGANQNGTNNIRDDGSHRAINEELFSRGKYKTNLICPKCGARRSSHARFCEYCGEQFEAIEKDSRMEIR